MSLNLVKLCVGIESAEDFIELTRQRRELCLKAGKTYEPFHTTRMIPKRKDELLDGGSLYWIIKGNIQLRQSLLDIRPFTDSDGISRCDLVLSPDLIPTQWQPRRPFQGWRYLKAEDAPSDLSTSDDADQMPLEFRQELSSLGLL